MNNPNTLTPSEREAIEAAAKEWRKRYDESRQFDIRWNPEGAFLAGAEFSASLRSERRAKFSDGSSVPVVDDEAGDDELYIAPGAVEKVVEMLGDASGDAGDIADLVERSLRYEREAQLGLRAHAVAEAVKAERERIAKDFAELIRTGGNLKQYIDVLNPEESK